MLIGDIPNVSKRRRFFSSPPDANSTASSRAPTRIPTSRRAKSSARELTRRNAWPCRPRSR